MVFITYFTTPYIILKAQLWRAIHSFYLAFMIFIIVYDSGKSLIRLSYLVPVTSTGKFEVKTLN